MGCKQGYNRAIFISCITRSCRTPFVLRGLTALSQQHQWKVKEFLWKERCSTAPCRCGVGFFIGFWAGSPKEGAQIPQQGCSIIFVWNLWCWMFLLWHWEEGALRLKDSQWIYLKVDCFLLKLTDLPQSCLFISISPIVLFVLLRNAKFCSVEGIKQASSHKGEHPCSPKVFPQVALCSKSHPICFSQDNFLSLLALCSAYFCP